MKKQEKKLKKRKKEKTWRLIYPDKTESLSNYDPIKEARQSERIRAEKMIDDLDGILSWSKMFKFLRLDRGYSINYLTLKDLHNYSKMVRKELKQKLRGGK